MKTQDEKRATKRKWYTTHRDQERLRKRKFYAEHIEQERARSRNRHRQNAEDKTIEMLGSVFRLADEIKSRPTATTTLPNNPPPNP